MFVFTSYTRELGMPMHVSHSWIECGIPTVWAGLTHEITIVRGQGRERVYSEDRSIYVLGVEPPAYPSYLVGMSIHVCTQLYTHVYTTVYTRVHYLTLSISSVGLACMSVSWE